MDFSLTGKILYFIQFSIQYSYRCDVLFFFFFLQKYQYFLISSLKCTIFAVHFFKVFKKRLFSTHLNFRRKADVKFKYPI